MTSAVPATRNNLLKLNGHSDTVSSQDYTRTTDSPESSPQFTFKCLDDTESPSSSASEDDPSDTNADESESQGLAGCARASSSMEQVHELEVDAKNPRIMHKKSSHRTSFGTDLDLSVIIALIAPLVNWLTGSDHLKSLFFVLFLIVYLHQLVQGTLHPCFGDDYVSDAPKVPWELYNASRRRRPHPSFRSLNLQENEEAVIKIQTKRATELRRHEFAYLFLSMVTPFAGAALLRSVLRSINGVDSISWFSTTLFVLAAGIRPWGHLTSRLREHTSSLHDSIHYPSPDSQFTADSRLQVVVDRINNLEQELSTVKRAMAMRAYVGDLQDTERTIRKQERKAESTRNSYDTRLAILEEVVSRIERTRGERVRGTALGGTVTTNGHRYMTNVIANVVSLPYRLAVGIIVAISPPLQHFFH